MVRPSWDVEVLSDKKSKNANALIDIKPYCLGALGRTDQSSEWTKLSERSERRLEQT